MFFDCNEILRILPEKVRGIMLSFENGFEWERLYEIRMRIGKAIILLMDYGEYYLDNTGITNKIEQAYILNEKELRESLQYMSNYSRYAYEEELKQGYLTIRGGHRVGVAGKTVCESGCIQTVQYISSINIRLAHEIRGCSIPYLRFLYNENWCNTLIIAPPGIGKTTFLRDIIRNVSYGFCEMRGQTVGVVDERGELAACYHGIPQNDLGPRTDVMDSCPKVLGMNMLLRSMKPEVIAVDEIGGQDDMRALENVCRSGCSIICTIHGDGYQDILNKPFMNCAITNKLFQRFVVLQRTNNGREVKVLNEKGEKV